MVPFFNRATHCRTDCDQLHSPRADQPIRLKGRVDSRMKAETALTSAFNKSSTPQERRCRVDGPCWHEQRGTPVSPGESKPTPIGNSRSRGVAGLLSYGGCRHGRMALVSRAAILEHPHVGRRRSCLDSGRAIAATHHFDEPARVCRRPEPRNESHIRKGRSTDRCSHRGSDRCKVGRD